MWCPFDSSKECFYVSSIRNSIQEARERNEEISNLKYMIGDWSSRCTHADNYAKALIRELSEVRAELEEVERELKTLKKEKK